MGHAQCRFAPSTSGHAHPGTLLAGLLAWLDARSRGAEILLRLEDLDPQRCTPEFLVQIQADLEWLGLTWDRVAVQSQHFEAHVAALDLLCKQGLVYPCNCTRAQIKAHNRRAADGGFCYSNRCREAPLPRGGWRSTEAPLRLRMPDGVVSPKAEDATDLAQDVSLAMGDPVVRRRDGAMAYHLAVVVDDAHAGVTHVVRGRDLAASTATQVAIYQYLERPAPTYRHHFLFLEPNGAKLAKLHRSVSAQELRAVYSAPQFCGLLAYWAGLLDTPEDCAPTELLPSFDWLKVRAQDVALTWTGRDLRPFSA